jgi:integrase
LFDDLHERPALANCVLASASATFNWALKRNMLEHNPCRGIEHHKVRSSKRFLTNDEIRAVWALFDALELYPAYALKLILITAQRPGEVCAMRWEHVDLDAGLWMMPGEPAHGWPGTKNGRDHEVPLTDPALALLMEIFETQGFQNGYVFPSVRRGRCIGIPSTVSIWQAAGIDRFRPHDLRATAATKMDELGIAREHIGLVLNHAQSGITASYVRHDKRQHKRIALEAWATELEAILAGKGRTDRKAEIVPIARRPRKRNA